MSDLQLRDGTDLLTAALTREEQEIVRELLTTQKPAAEVIPDDITPDDLWRYLSATCKGVRRVEDARARLKFWLGRMLVKIQAYPQLYEAQGYANFSDFVANGLDRLFGVSRNEGFIVKRIDEQLGKVLSIEQMTDIGIVNLSIAASAIRSETSDGTPPEKREEITRRWIDLARTKTGKEMKTIMVANGLIEKGDLDLTVITLTVQKSVEDKWRTFRGQKWVSAKVGSTDSGLLNCLMAEAASWEAEFNEAARDKQAGTTGAVGPATEDEQQAWAQSALPEGQ